MKIILLRDIPSVGRKNELKDVREGYARNFLLPRKLAIIANETTLKSREKDEAKREFERTEDEKKNKDVAEKLKSLELRFKVKIGEKGKAFGSVSRNDIQEALKKRGMAIEKGQIELDENIKQTGEHTVKIILSSDISGEVNVIVEPE